MLPTAPPASGGTQGARRSRTEPGEEGGELPRLRSQAASSRAVELRGTQGFGTVESDEEPSAADVKRQRAYADWLSSLEPPQKRRRQGEDGLGLGADEVTPGPANAQPDASRAGMARTRRCRNDSLNEAIGSAEVCM